MIGWLIKAVAGPVGPYLAGAMAAVLALSVGAALWQTRALEAAKVDLVEARQDARDWKAKAEGWEASFRQSEGQRGVERARAAAAINEASSTCDARVAEARRSSAAIRTIIQKEPARDPQGCPVRQLVPADSLRDALQPAAR